ncbi:MAG: hypothetical protein AAFX41_03690 [Bacteroidota bacterium]
MLAFLLALVMLSAPATSTLPDPYEGFYGCNLDGDEHYVVWIGTVGTGTRATQQWTTYQLFNADDFPFDDELRQRSGSGYHTRGGTFNSGNSAVDFADGTLLLQDEPCEPVATLRDLLTLFGLDVDDAVQEVVDFEGWTPEQVAARLDDAAFADAAFRPGNEWRGAGGGSPRFAEVIRGLTLPEPPPPPNAAPTGAPVAADDYEGIYSDGRMLYVIRDGRFVQFEDDYDGDWLPRVQYVFEPRRYYPKAYDYRVVNGEFQSGDASTMEFLRRDGEVAALVWRGKELPRVYTLAQLFEAGDYDVEPFTAELRQRGMDDAAVKAVMEDAARFADVIREGNAPITFEKLTGLED